MLGKVESLGIKLDGESPGTEPVKKVAKSRMAFAVLLRNDSKYFDIRTGGNVGIPCEVDLFVSLGRAVRYSKELSPAFATWTHHDTLKANETKWASFYVVLPEGWEPEELCSLALNVQRTIALGPEGFDIGAAKFMYKDVIDLLSPGIVGQMEQESMIQNKRINDSLIA